MRSRRRRRGSAYVIALVALLTGMTLGLAALRLSTNGALADARRQNDAAARQAAEAGSDYGLWLTKWSNVNARPYTAAVSLGAASITVTIADNSAAIAGTDRMTSVATVRGTTRTAVRIVKKEGSPTPFAYGFALNKTTTITRGIRSDANCAMFVNGSVTFNNSSINMAGPVSATGTITRTSGTLSGLLTPGAPGVTWPGIDPSWYQAQAAVYYSSSKTLSGLAFPYDGAIVYCNGTLTVKGTVAGKGTCVAAVSIVLDGVTQQAGSVIACVSQGTVQVKSTVTSLTGICYAHKSDSTGVIRLDGTTSLTGPMAGDGLTLNSTPTFRWDSTVFNDATYTLLKLPGYY